jgi:DNA-binding NtrC family response regulator
MTYRANILIVDGDETAGEALVRALVRAGYRAKSVNEGMRALSEIDRVSYDVVVLDLDAPGMPGMEVLKRIRESDPTSIVIAMTAGGTIDAAVGAMRAGARDFMTRPFTNEAFLEAVTGAIESRRRDLERAVVDAGEAEGASEYRIIGCSPAVLRVADLIRQVAPTDSTVLVHGSTGVGKELVAWNIHRLSLRRDKPFVVVDCGALVESLFESEMFGHAKGSFTGAIDTTRGKFELASGGTIFLDEISNISTGMQSRLLRVIEEREISKVGSLEKIKVDVRIIAATNRDLSREIREGRFREDLYYRLNVVPIYLPPLRERREDIPILVEHFLSRAAVGGRACRPGISGEAMGRLMEYDWPGNIRELKNTIEYAVVTCCGEVIGPGELPIAGPPADGGGGEGLNGSLAQSEKREILRALEQFEGRKARAAEFLGINRKTLREKMRRYGIG